ncbi:phosphomannomutase/phosphoglucomutase [Candidatus Peregrinibacteria bacterium]|nr:phosphomannomutase/phosphoglucomutase [Candidatus Peregrinibacteria bacterium]
MNVNPLIFRAYDIRGIAQTSEKYPQKDIDEDIAYLLGKGIGTYIKKHYGPKIAVGRDNRLTGEKIEKALISGLLSIGANIVKIGLSTSPLLYYTVCKYDLDGGINITASHNPKEYNGFKIVGAKGHSICGDELQIIRKSIEENMVSSQNFQNSAANAKPTTKPWQKNKKIWNDYLLDMKKLVKKPIKPLKVVIDAGSGTTGLYAPKLLKHFGYKTVELYCELDGNFPFHTANPEEYENMKDLIQKVIEEKADIGIGFDGDGDRIGIVDEKGTFYAADYLLILLARDLLSRHKQAKIVYDLKSSRILEQEIKKHGGLAIMAKTGHSFIEQTMKREGALLGGEVSGHMFFAENYYGFDDAFLAALKVLEIVSNSGMPLSKHFENLKKTAITPEIKVPCQDDKKFAIVDEITNKFKRTHACITIDGVRIDFGNEDWGIVRSSNTSPCLTLRFEAGSAQKLKEIKKIVYESLKKYKEVDNSWYEIDNK